MCLYLGMYVCRNVNQIRWAWPIVWSHSFRSLLVWKVNFSTLKWCWKFCCFTFPDQNHVFADRVISLCSPRRFCDEFLVKKGAIMSAFTFTNSSVLHRSQCFPLIDTNALSLNCCIAETATSTRACNMSLKRASRQSVKNITPETHQIVSIRFKHIVMIRLSVFLNWFSCIN